MNGYTLRNRLFYMAKPMIPRGVQLFLRRKVVASERKKHDHIWPIDQNSARPPMGWTGWPHGKQFALLLSHDVDTAKGYHECLKLADLEERLGFRSNFNFIPERYGRVSLDLLDELRRRGFGIAVHGLKHDGKLFSSKRIFDRGAARINEYLKEWKTTGFTSPSMHHNLAWLTALNIEYSTSTFDTDPFEPQPDAASTIFPFWVQGNSGDKGFVEMPYTLPQDSTLFVIMKEKDAGIWKGKLDWVARNGGMALLITHPDYMHFGNEKNGPSTYPARYYEDFLQYTKVRYEGMWWNVLPEEVARFWLRNYALKDTRLTVRSGKKANSARLKGKTVWIDLDNSPHVPFFRPIIKELNGVGCNVLVTARDCSQTCSLADLFRLEYRRVGRHYGKNKILKVAGTVYRAWQLAQIVNKEDLALAISHGSRAQIAAAKMLGIPCLSIMDYEHVTNFVAPTWVMAPDLIASESIKFDKNHLLRYPGIKEDVYVPFFRPNAKIKQDLSIGENDLVVTIRPPATEAHYHNPESEILFSETINYLGRIPDVRMVVLPRNGTQDAFIKDRWAQWTQEAKMIIPDHVVDGLNLLWHSDLAISGGGTMNREAAALGIPVYSIFRGKIGDVDRYLSQAGRLILLKSVDDLMTKLKIVRRSRLSEQAPKRNAALDAIMDGIVAMIESRARMRKSRTGTKPLAVRVLQSATANLKG